MAHDIKKKWRTDDVKLKENADFSSLLLSDRVLSGLTKAGFRRPSPIQFEAIPIGRYGIDLLVQAKSGTGKTLVFTVLALEKLQPKLFRPQVMIMAPTREIATQICSVIKLVGSSFPKLTCHSFIGGLSVENDKDKAYTCQIAVGTPGRLKQLIQIGCLPTASIRLFVLDEADQLLESSFKPAIEDIFNVLPKDKQVVATSATYPPEMKKLLFNYLVEPHIVSLSAKKLALLGIVHYAKIVPNSLMPFMTYKYKLDALGNILKKLRYSQCLIFCNGLAKVELLCRDIKKWGFSTTYISSAKEQVDRQKAIDRLKQFKCKILVSSDVAARGIDAENVDLVINFEIPMCTETYLHRAGRAGRYGSHGVAISLLNEKEIKSMDEREVEGGFKTFKLPDPLPSDLIRNPVMGELLIEDTDICEDKKSNGCNGNKEADEVLPDTAAFQDDIIPENRYSQEQQSSNSNTKIENSTTEQSLENGDTNSSECTSNTSLGKSASPKIIDLKRQLIDSKIKSFEPEKYPDNSTTNISEHLLNAPLIETCRNAGEYVELHCSEGVTSKLCLQNGDDVVDSPDNLSEAASEDISPVKENSNKEEPISNNINADVASGMVNHVCTSVSNVPEHMLDEKRQKVEKINIEFPTPLFTDNKKVPECRSFEIENSKATEHAFEIYNSSSTIVEGVNYTQNHFGAQLEDSSFCLASPQDCEISDNGPLISQKEIALKSGTSCTVSDVINSFPNLSPQEILDANPRKQFNAEIPLKCDCENWDESDITKIADSLKENIESSDEQNLEQLINIVGKFGSYEEYDLSFNISSFLEEYEKNKKDLSFSGGTGCLISVEHADKDNYISSKMVKDLMSEKSDFYHKVLKAHLQECMIANDSSNDNKTGEKCENMLINNNQTETEHAFFENKIKGETVSNEFEETSKKLLLEDAENSHLVDSSSGMINTVEAAVKFGVSKFESTPGRGEILFCRPGYENSDSDSDVMPAVISQSKVKLNTASVDSNSVSSPSSKNESVQLNKQNQRKKSSSSSSDFDSSSDSDSYTSLQSKKQDTDSLRRSDSSSDSESSSSSSDSDSSAYKRNTQSNKRNMNNFQESDSSSDSDSSDSNDSNLSLRKRNVQANKKDVYETESSSDSEYSSLSSDTYSSYKNRRNKVDNFHNTRSTFHMQQNSTPFTSFSSAARHSMFDCSKFVPGFVETPCTQYNYSHCKNVHMPRESSTRQFRVYAQCAKDQHTHCCMKKNHKQSHNCLKNRRNHKFRENCVSPNLDTNSHYSMTHSHTEKCYRPSSHRCHPMLPNFSCSNEVCAQWYNIFYTQWMCIRRHANLPF